MLEPSRYDYLKYLLAVWKYRRSAEGHEGVGDKALKSKPPEATIGTADKDADLALVLSDNTAGRAQVRSDAHCLHAAGSKGPPQCQRVGSSLFVV